MFNIAKFIRSFQKYEYLFDCSMFMDCLFLDQLGKDLQYEVRYDYKYDWKLGDEECVLKTRYLAKDNNTKIYKWNLKNTAFRTWINTFLGSQDRNQPFALQVLHNDKDVYFKITYKESITENTFELVKLTDEMLTGLINKHRKKWFNKKIMTDYENLDDKFKRKFKLLDYKYKKNYFFTYRMLEYGVSMYTLYRATKEAYKDDYYRRLLADNS